MYDFQSQQNIRSMSMDELDNDELYGVACLLVKCDVLCRVERGKGWVYRVLSLGGVGERNGLPQALME